MGKKKRGNRVGVDRALDRFDNSCKVPFRYLSTTACSSSVKTITFASGYVSDGTQASSRLQGIANQFSLFRFVKMKVTVYPTAASTEGGVCYVPTNSQASTPSSVAEILEQSHATYVRSSITMPRSFSLSKRDLTTQMPWYRTTAAGDNSEYTQCYIMARTAGLTDVVPIVIEGVVEYKGAVDSDVALNRLKKQVLEGLGLSLPATSLPLLSK